MTEQPGTTTTLAEFTMRNPQTTDVWPPTDASGLARVLHENDRTMGEATGAPAGCDWSALPNEARIRLLLRAEAEIVSGRFVLGAGWLEQFL